MLSGKQRGYLSRLSSNIDATLMIGKDGLSGGVEEAFIGEFKHRELVKLRFIASKEERFELAQTLADKYGIELVRVIGNVAVFYKSSEDPEKRKIVLP